MDPASSTSTNPPNSSEPAASAPSALPTTPIASMEDTYNPAAGAMPNFGATSTPQAAPTTATPQFGAAAAPTTIPGASPQSSFPGEPPAGDQPPIATASGSGGGSKRKKVMAVFSVLLMLVGIGAGVYLVRRQQLGSSFAWDCSLYTFSISDNGTVIVRNGSTVHEQEQQAKVYINGNLVDTFDVPALDPGKSETLGTVNLPSGDYSWSVDGTKDCKATGSSLPPVYVAQCSNVEAYDTKWNKLSSDDLSSLKAGDVVRFAVSGTTTKGTLDKARFTINGASPVETDQKEPGTDKFYYEYTIPDGVSSFSIKAELRHSESGWF